MTPDDAPILDPAPRRNAKGQFAGGDGGGNPGGVPRRARLFRNGAAAASQDALELLQQRLKDAKDAPYKRITVGRGEDAQEMAVPTIADRDLVAMLEVMAKHGGHVPPAEMARLLLQARNTGAIDKPEDWDRFAALVEPEYTAPVDAEEEPTP